MKICYIISTCNKYLETRVKYQMETMFKNVNNNDIYYLTSKPNIEKRQFGWNCMDDIQNITWKYIHFFHNMNIPDYDWYIFIDDDTFVFENRLQNLLKTYNSDDYYYIGKELDHIKDDFCLYMSGGAGYAMSNALYSLFISFLKKKGRDEAYYPHINLETQCDDLCIGMWIQDIVKENNQIKFHQINNNLFHYALQENENDINTAITFHKVITQEQYEYYTKIYDIEIQNINTIKNNDTTVFSLVTDLKYFNKAKRTIIDLRCKGNWNGEIVLITIDFDLNNNFKDFYNITEVKFPLIDKTILLEKIGFNGFYDTTDKREINKLNQWEKLHIFDDYFRKWSRVVYLDSGLRVLDDVKYLLEINCNDVILAPKDGKFYDTNNNFTCQLSYDNPELIYALKNDFGEHIFKSKFMLNCMWMYDTNILNLCDKAQLIDAMNKYTLCKTNEMGIMNLLFTFKYNLWERFPIKTSNGKFLFDWCELNQDYNTNWREYCFIKYPVTISFDDT